MNDFFQTIYDHAMDTNALRFSLDPEYRMADHALDKLVETLHPDLATQEKISNAVNDLFYRSNIIALAYGFRLAIRVTGPIC